jgi:hypothetical protein
MDEKLVPVTQTFTVAQLRWLEEKCAKNKIDRTQYIRDAVQSLIEADQE